MAVDGGRPPEADPFDERRARMVSLQLESRGIREPETLAAMRAVPRHEFVPPSIRDRAYEDGAQAIGHGQSISQPFIVARMTEALDLPGYAARNGVDRPRVLDVGTGSGYQAAILAQMGADVTSIERDPDLASSAAERLRWLGYDIEVIVGDGSAGYEPNAPYAGIVVAAASPGVPDPLVQQLAQDGRLVVPVGPREHQELLAIHRVDDRLERRTLEPAVFVPLVGRHGYSG